MRKTLRFIAFAVLALAAPASHAATITYDAVVGCDNTCVTVDLTWANWPTPIGYVEVDDNFGDFLFALNIPFAGTTGEIQPLPQTISGLSPDIIALIENGGASLGGVQDLAESNFVVHDDDVPTYANLCLDSADRQDDCDSGVERFVATSAPEPAAWSLTGAGLALLFAWRARRRKFQTGTGATTLE
jgi:MYXO-CTERM domain-containing protein